MLDVSSGMVVQDDMGALRRLSVAAGILPAVSPGRPARRIKHLNPPTAGTFQNRTHLPSFFPGGETPALHGRRDVCRYHTGGAAFPTADQTVPCSLEPPKYRLGRSRRAHRECWQRLVTCPGTGRPALSRRDGGCPALHTGKRLPRPRSWRGRRCVRGCAPR